MNRLQSRQASLKTVKIVPISPLFTPSFLLGLKFSFETKKTQQKRRSEERGDRNCQRILIYSRMLMGCSLQPPVADMVTADEDAGCRPKRSQHLELVPNLWGSWRTT
jgi:hypothetical protein